MPRIEYRVRAVTRYIVTRCEVADDPHNPTGGSVQQRGEFDSADVADTIAEALALQEREAFKHPDAVALPYVGPPPGRVMRCKVNLTSRAPAFKRKDGQWAHASEPADIEFDGEHLAFHAVCPPTCDSTPNASPENAIFGEMTPNFSLSCQVRNLDVLDALERGRSYYVDFIPAPIPPPAS